MEELYIAGNDGELSFLENDGNILLDQGHQGFIPSGEQHTQNIIYTQQPQLQEQQVYIVHHAPVQTTDPQQHPYAYRNIGPTSAYGQVTYSSRHIAQSPQQVIQQKQIVQTGINRNEEYSIVQEVQPQQHGILHIVPQQQQIQLPSIVELPVHHQQQDLQVPNQLQQKPNAVIIPQNAQQITFIPKSNVRTSENIKGQSTVNIYQSPTTQQQITLAIEPPNSVPPRMQRVQRGGSFATRIQSPTSLIQTSPVRPRGLTSQAGQRPRPPAIANSRSDIYLKHLEHKTAIAARGKNRGGKNSAAQQRKLCSQKINYNVGNNIETDISQTIHEGASTHDKNAITINDKLDAQNNVISTQSKQNLSQQIILPKRTDQVVSVTKQSLPISETITNSSGTKIIHFNKEKQSQSNLVNVCVLDKKRGQKLFLVPSNLRGNLSGSVESASRSGISDTENVQQRLVYIKDDSEIANISDAINCQEVIPLTPKGVNTPHSNKLLGRSIGKAPIIEKNQVMKKPLEFVIRQQQQQQLTQQQQKKENLVLCSHCGIQTESFVFCSSCKHPLNRGLDKDSNLLHGDNSSSSLPQRLLQSEKKPLIRGRGRGRGGRGRGRSYDEPVILTLTSSDEEDEEGAPSSKDMSSTFPTPSLAEQFLFNTSVMNKKEPVIPANFDNEIDSNNLTLYYTAKSNQRNLPSCLPLKCRSIRIGSYKVTPLEDIEIKQNEYIQMVVPPFAEGESEPVVIKISFLSMLTILAHFNNSLPVIFIYLRPSPAMQIRKQLKMCDRNRYYFNPSSIEESHKRITILPERFDEEIKKILRDQLSGLELEVKGEKSKLFKELDQREANEILVRSSPQDVQSLLPKNLRTDTETTSLFVYPPPPQKGGIQITTDDYCCLEEEQFLNDVILDFYLKWLMLSRVSEKDRERTHVFSTFFYKRLTSKPKGARRPPQTEEESKLSPAQKRHARVQSWTKNVDIFSKDFILIPINEHSHWFLAVICFPGLDGPVRLRDGEPVIVPIEKVKKNYSAKPKTKIEIPIIDDGEWSDRDEAEGDEEELNEEEDEEEEAEEPSAKKMKLGEEESGNFKDENTLISNESKHPPSALSKKDLSVVAEPIKQPCILIFDSLSGASRSRIVATLRDYLTIEHQKKKNKEKLFTKDTMKGACPKVPQQMNFSDCGLFTLQFAESFFESPVKDFKLPIKTLSDWFDQGVVSGKRKSIAMLIESLMDEHKPNHNITLPQIHFNSPKEKASPEDDNNEERKIKDKLQVQPSEEEESTIKYEEYLQESQEQSLMLPGSRKININLNKRNMSNNDDVAVSGESQRSDNFNSSGNFSNKELIFNRCAGLSNIDMSKENETSSIEGSKINVNKSSNSIESQSSEEDIIGKSPGRIEIMDDAQLLLVFNKDPNAEDGSQVTEINIQSLDSFPEFSKASTSTEEAPKPSVSHSYVVASSESSSSMLFSSGQQTFAPIRNTVYQSSSTASTSGTVTNSVVYQNTISSTLPHEKGKYISNTKFANPSQQEPRRQSIGESCSSTLSSDFNEEQLLLPGAPKSQLQKERWMLQQRQQQQKNFQHQHLMQERKLMHQKLGIKSTNVPEQKITENQVHRSQQINTHQTAIQSQNKISISQTKQQLHQRQQKKLQQLQQQSKSQMLHQRHQEQQLRNVQQGQQQFLPQHKQPHQNQEQLSLQNSQILQDQNHQQQLLQQQQKQQQLQQQLQQQQQQLQQRQQQQQIQQQQQLLQQQHLQQNQHQIQSPCQQQNQTLHEQFLQQKNKKNQQILEVSQNQNNKPQRKSMQKQTQKEHQKLEQEQLKTQKGSSQQQQSKFKELGQDHHDQQLEKQKHLQSEQNLHQAPKQEQQKQSEQHLQKEKVQNIEQRLEDNICYQELERMTDHKQTHKKLCTEKAVSQRLVQSSKEDNSNKNQEMVKHLDKNQCNLQSKPHLKDVKSENLMSIFQEEALLDHETEKVKVINSELKETGLKDTKAESSVVIDQPVPQNVVNKLKPISESQSSSVPVTRENASVEDKIKKSTNTPRQDFENITRSKSNLSALNNSLPPYSQQTLSISSVSTPTVTSTISRGISSSSPITMQPQLPSRTTSRGRVVNTPMKYRDMEDVFVSSKRSRGATRVTRVRNLRNSDNFTLKDDDFS